MPPSIFKRYNPSQLCRAITSGFRRSRARLARRMKNPGHASENMRADIQDDRCCTRYYKQPRIKLSELRPESLASDLAYEFLDGIRRRDDWEYEIESDDESEGDSEEHSIASIENEVVNEDTQHSVAASSNSGFGHIHIPAPPVLPGEPSENSFQQTISLGAYNQYRGVSIVYNSRGYSFVYEDVGFREGHQARGADDDDFETEDEDEDEMDNISLESFGSLLSLELNRRVDAILRGDFPGPDEEIWDDDPRLQPPTYDDRDELPRYEDDEAPPEY